MSSLPRSLFYTCVRFLIAAPSMKVQYYSCAVYLCFTCKSKTFPSSPAEPLFAPGRHHPLERARCSVTNLLLQEPQGGYLPQSRCSSVKVWKCYWFCFAVGLSVKSLPSRPFPEGAEQRLVTCPLSAAEETLRVPCREAGSMCGRDCGLWDKDIVTFAGGFIFLCDVIRVVYFLLK